MAAHSAQTPLNKVAIASLTDYKKEIIPGKNPAYYTGPASKDQLLHIHELDMVPYPPPMNQRCFAYLRGALPEVDGLGEARFKWKTRRVIDDSNADIAPYVVDVPLTDFPYVAIRQGGSGQQHYVRELKPGTVEFIADYELLTPVVKKGNYSIGITIVLPYKDEERVVTSFEGPLEVK